MKTSPPPPPFDLLAEIGRRREAVGRTSLVAPEPPALPERLLTLRRREARAVFTPEPKLDTPAKLTRELTRSRRAHARFLRELAPPAPATRLSRGIAAFDWRVATPEDWRDFPAVLAGAGAWRRVEIPHYDEPLGKVSTFYRASFELTVAEIEGRALFVTFKGVDYIAHVFVNGCLLGSHEGFFAPFEFEFGRVARPGRNELFVRVDNDNPTLGTSNHDTHGNTDGDKIYAGTGPGYDEPVNGWHHCPPAMGIHDVVGIDSRPRVHVADLYVRPLPAEGRAEAWVEVRNTHAAYRDIGLRFSLHGRNFRATRLRNRDLGAARPAGPGVNYYRFSLPMEDARIWEPDTPWLHELRVDVIDAATGERDTRTRSFGQRSFTMDEASVPKGRLALNGREIRLRGANTMGFEQRDVMEGRLDRLRDDLLLAKIAHMNFLRITQRPVQQEVYDLCDRLGLLTQTDLPLFGYLRRNQFCEATRQAQEMERLVRSHPCNILVSYINEPFPQSWGDKSHRHLTRAELEDFFAAATLAVRLVNPDRVVKPVDGDYDAPGPGICDLHCYTFWYNGHAIDAGKLHRGFWQPVKPGWHHGCGEFGAEGIDRAELLRKYCPADWLPQSTAEEATWSPGRIAKAQSGRFHRLFFDTRHTLEDWAEASQAHQAWSTRLTTEALRRLPGMNTFAIHLFIDAWPAGWMKTILDYERWPKPAYFAYREALTPLAVQLRTDRWHFWSGETARVEAWVCNDTARRADGDRLHYQLEVGGEIVLAERAPARFAPCRADFQGFITARLPEVARRTPAILRLALTDTGGAVRHSTTLELAIFPAPVRLKNLVWTPGRRASGAARRFARVLGLKTAKRPEAAAVILIDDMATLRRHETRIGRLVKAGAVALILDLPAGRHAFLGSVVEVAAPAMGPRHFVSRATGHPAVADFEPADFRFWHDARVDRVTPLLDRLFFAEGWHPLLLTAQEQAGQTWQDAFAAAEKPLGRGCLRISLLKPEHIVGNPTARLFAARLLDAPPV